METREKSILRVNDERFDLPEVLHGSNHIHTAVTHGKEYINVSIEDACFDFGHAAMQLLLRRLSDTSRNGERADPIVRQAFDELQRHFESNVRD
ncbi:MAG: hypothetical protein PHO20_02930 [Candidatus Peribacteraceae bacterium]|nr:hypothetical protein [Candidatus Peribacteraceae bacterium]MDD5739695.1 hypothetical protein [Candidatus Peribacteraceae bacterium]